MRFGDANTLAIEIEPVQPSWQPRSPGDLGPRARLSLWVHGKNLTANWMPGTTVIREGVFVPLEPIASWLVRMGPYLAWEESAARFPTGNDLHRSLAAWREAMPAQGITEEAWDDARYEWTERHFLLAGSDGARLDRGGSVVLLEGSWSSKPWVRRMEALRGAGHLLLDAELRPNVIGAGSSRRACGPRRHRSGAFAAEMLLPEGAMRERSEGRLDGAAQPQVFERMMEDYGVGARVAAFQLWNHGFLSSPEVREDLLDAYAPMQRQILSLHDGSREGGRSIISDGHRSPRSPS